MRLKVVISIAVMSVAALFGACSDDPGTTPSPDAGPPDTGVEPKQDANEIPCGPRLVLQTICQQCHTKPMKNGAPFPLINRSDILAVRSKFVIRELMIQQLETRRMPLSPVTITDEQRTTLVTWLKEGALAVSPQECTPIHDAGPDSDAADTGAEDAGDGDASDASDDGPIDN